MTRRSQRLLVQTARVVLSTVAPLFYRQLSYYRNEGRRERIFRKLSRRHGLAVLNGPFRGMHYVHQAVGSVLNPKLVGSYEAELHDLVERLISKGYDTIVNIGCAEGYYAVGLLFRMPKARCIAFDPDPKARTLCGEMASANKVADRLEIRGGCDPAQLASAVRGKTFILSDCEGAEFDLLDRAAIPALRRCDLLVEVHDFILPGLTRTVTERFASTHDIEIVSQAVRNPRQYPHLAMLCESEQFLAVEEFRPARMQWAMLTVRAHK